jgi:hypothetical protein
MDLLERPAQASRRHPWEVSRFRFFQRVLRDANQLQTPSRVLDAGAGDAWFSRSLLASLPSDAQVTCWDAGYSPELLASLQDRATSRMRFVSERPAERFDTLLMLDVLEHVERDFDFLTSIVRENLAHGATVLMSVPAWPALYTSHDTRLKHHRRYTPDEAAALLTRAGLTILRRGGLFHSLLVPRTVSKVRELIARPPADDSVPALTWNGSALTTRVVEWSLAADNMLSWIASRTPSEVPGLTWWALCKAP